MSDEFGNWRDLAKLWHAGTPVFLQAEVERDVQSQRRWMQLLAGAEMAAMVLAFIAAVWIAMHTAFVAMSAISIVFFGACGYLQHRMRSQPEPAGGDDLLTTLEAGGAREEWMLRQLGIGRAVTLTTLASIGIVASDHLRHFASTPAERLWALLAITLIVVVILAWNLVLTRHAKQRQGRLDDYSRHLNVGPESRRRVRP
jgi:FtsH-binding integral membrane protein